MAKYKYWWLFLVAMGCEAEGDDGFEVTAFERSGRVDRFRVDVEGEAVSVDVVHGDKGVLAVVREQDRTPAYRALAIDGEATLLEGDELATAPADVAASDSYARLAMAACLGELDEVASDEAFGFRANNQTDGPRQRCFDGCGLMEDMCDVVNWAVGSSIDCKGGYASCTLKCPLRNTDFLDP